MNGISYELRPSKTVTRLILVDVLRHLESLTSISKYQYVGFGAVEFIDFDLMHRAFGISKMTSIEGDTALAPRCEWNRPFKGIKVLEGRSTTILPTLDWSMPSIVWLDYTSTLTTEVIGDVEHMIRVLIPGSVLAVTVNAHPARYKEREAALEKAIGADNIPLGVSENTLGNWGLADVQYKVLDAEIRSTCGDRTDGATWRQVLNIRYSDNAKMQMLAGIVGSPVLDSALDNCRFDEVEELRKGAEAVEVRVPLLTTKERAWLNEQLPLLDGDATPELQGVKEKEIVAYQQIYRRLQGAGGSSL